MPLIGDTGQYDWTVVTFHQVDSIKFEGMVGHYYSHPKILML